MEGPRGEDSDLATHCDRPQIVPFLLSNIADPRICNERWPRANSALRVGASQLRSESLELMMHAMEQYNVEQGRAGSRDVLVAELLEQDVHGSSLFDMIFYHAPKYQQAIESTFNYLLPRVSRIAYDAYGGFKQTLLYFAVSLARDELVHYLVKQGADVIKARTDHDGEVIESQDNDAFHLADSLVSHGADLNFTTLSCGHLTLSNPTTILGHVIASNARNSIERLRYLLGSPSMRDGLHLIVEPARQRSALHRAAAAHIDVEFHGTDAAEAAELHWADVDWSANREIMNEILRHFNGPEQLYAVETSTGLSPMHLAVLAGNEAAVSLLLDHGARSDVPSEGVQGATAADTALGIQMGGLFMIEEIGRPGREEVAARKQCSNLLNPATQSAAQAQPALA
ncbi:hypothetical protein Focb16_v015483 [Fusarium oxysporum f. sp. cubense]|uniref:Uncharacterized protein n=1 Tax=Fusarium oxysporum f. sp. cubense TaxID=61366 RepID=A0A559KWB5_FUSOC|nr:hypothetical protein Focb16_v015483 [Fusarium oxysporum f. sp. cubense]